MIKCCICKEKQNIEAVFYEGEVYHKVCKDIEIGDELLVWYGDGYRSDYLAEQISTQDSSSRVSISNTSSPKVLENHIMKMSHDSNSEIVQNLETQLLPSCSTVSPKKIDKDSITKDPNLAKVVLNQSSLNNTEMIPKKTKMAHDKLTEENAPMILRLKKLDDDSLSLVENDVNSTVCNQNLEISLDQIQDMEIDEGSPQCKRSKRLQESLKLSRESQDDTILNHTATKIHKDQVKIGNDNKRETAYNQKTKARNSTSKLKNTVRKSTDEPPGQPSKFDVFTISSCSCLECADPNIHHHNQYTCNECGKTYLCANVLEKHQKFHYLRKAEDIRVCPTCGEAFLKPENLKNHQISEHGSKKVSKSKWTCNVCSKVFNSFYSVNEHRKSEHDTILNHRCTLCDKAFAGKKALNLHFQTHTNERKFPCDMCEKSFKHRQSLRRHKVKLHIVPKGHICYVCDQQFDEEISLRSHVITAHKGDLAEMKEYECDVCRDIFDSPHFLRLHLYEVHKQKMRHKIFNKRRVGTLGVVPYTLVQEKNKTT